jgi:thiamine biosynthesis lipoprotein
LFVDKPILTQNAGLYQGSFMAYGHRCELQIETSERQVADQLFNCVSGEVRRIAEKYTYNVVDNSISKSIDSIMTRINKGTAESIIVDAETASLLDFSDACYQLSEGRFDVCCRAIQCNKKAIALNKNKGWQEIRWDNPRLRLLQGMQLNFNGIIKAHACDRALSLANEISKVPMLLSMGGIRLSNKSGVSSGDWLLEHLKSSVQSTAQSMQIQEAAIVTIYSTSKEPLHYNYYDGRNNQAITESPVAITVAAANCTEANMIATLAMLRGEDAEQYLSTQQVTSWIKTQ